MTPADYSPQQPASFTISTRFNASQNSHLPTPPLPPKDKHPLSSSLFQGSYFPKITLYKITKTLPPPPRWGRREENPIQGGFIIRPGVTLPPLRHEGRRFALLFGLACLSTESWWYHGLYTYKLLVTMSALVIGLFGLRKAMSRFL